MRLALLFSKRYFSSRKSHSVINIISRVSSLAVGVPVAAMVILLSVFNGFEGLVKNLYSEFDPDISIGPAAGKFFSNENFAADRVLSTPGVQNISFVLEDNALIEYRGRQYIGTVRGVDSLYDRVVPIQNMMVAGDFQPYFGDMMQAVIGQGLAYNLGVIITFYDPVKVMIPRQGSFSTLLPVDAYREGRIYPSGIFALDAETDGKYMIVPIQFTRELFANPDAVSTVMVKLREGYDPDKVRSEISATLGQEYNVLTRYQQKATLYRIMTYEKWGIFVIVLMVMIIASFAIVGSLVMLIIDKKEDIKTILGFGGSVKFVRNIFIWEGMLISMIGAVGGMLLGLVFCWVQLRFGVIKIPADTFLIDSYPVMVKVQDLIVVIAAYTSVCYLITIFTVRRMLPRSVVRI